MSSTQNRFEAAFFVCMYASSMPVNSLSFICFNWDHKLVNANAYYAFVKFINVKINIFIDFALFRAYELIDKLIKGWRLMILISMMIASKLDVVGVG